MRLYRECRGGGDVSIDYKDGRWEVLFLIADVVLRYKPKAKSKPARKRQRRAKRERTNPQR